MKEFNIVITGIGGHGVVTLENIIAEAALKQGWDVKTSELHGLAQRGGTITCHVRFGEKMYTPLVFQGEANLVIGLEPLEALRASFYGSKEHKTVFVLDSYRVIPLSVYIANEKYPSVKEIRNELKKFSKRVIILNASEVVQKVAGDNLMTNIYMIGYISGKKLLPLNKKSLLESIEKIVPEKYLEINKKVFEIGFKQK